MSSTLLSNYILSISLLKNIAKAFTQTQTFNLEFQTYINEIRRVEKILFKLGSIDGIPSHNSSECPDDPFEIDSNGNILSEEGGGVAVSFLISQHKREILNQGCSFKSVLKQTFNKEFMNMLQVCIFVPFLHSETPKP
jgi:hypothetical protein